jgi:hypothetical protein
VATLSNYLSGGSTAGRPTSGARYPAIQRYRPYSPPRINSGYRTQDSPFAGQDFASALIASQQQAKAVTPSTTFENTFNYDPILSKLQALSSQTVANASTNAAQLRNEAAITTGDPSLLKSLAFDDNTINAATQNPESLYAQLQKEYVQRSRDLEESMNARNLMYSGEYDRNLQELAQGKASAEGELGARLRELLSQADTGLLGAKETARQNALEAQIAQANARNFAEGLTPGQIPAGGSLGADWLYGATLPSGVSDESVYSRAQQYAPSYGGVKYVPAHIMNQGQIVDGKVAVKYVDPTGVNPPDTVWIDVSDILSGASNQNQVQNQNVAPIAVDPDPVATATAAAQTSGVVDPLSHYLGGGTFGS